MIDFSDPSRACDLHTVLGHWLSTDPYICTTDMEDYVHGSSNCMHFHKEKTPKRS